MAGRPFGSVPNFERSGGNPRRRRKTCRRFKSFIGNGPVRDGRKANKPRSLPETGVVGRRIKRLNSRRVPGSETYGWGRESEKPYSAGLGTRSERTGRAKSHTRPNLPAEVETTVER